MFLMIDNERIIGHEIEILLSKVLMKSGYKILIKFFSRTCKMI